MVIIDETTKPGCFLKFDATVYLLYHPTSNIAPGFQCTIHVGSVRQTATVESIHNEEVSFVCTYQTIEKTIV